jgi:hypothetical protein
MQVGKQPVRTFHLIDKTAITLDGKTRRFEPSVVAAPVRVNRDTLTKNEVLGLARNAKKPQKRQADSHGGAWLE